MSSSTGSTSTIKASRVRKRSAVEGAAETEPVDLGKSVPSDRFKRYKRHTTSIINANAAMTPAPAPPRQRAATAPLITGTPRSVDPRRVGPEPQFSLAPGFKNPFAPDPLTGGIGSGFAPGLGGLGGLPTKLPAAPTAAEMPASRPAPAGSPPPTTAGPPPPQEPWRPARLDASWTAVQSTEQAAPLARKPWRIWDHIVPTVLFGAIIALPVVLFTAVPAAALLGFAMLPDAVIAGALVVGMAVLVAALYTYDRIRKNFTQHDILSARLHESAPIESPQP